MVPSTFITKKYVLTFANQCCIPFTARFSTYHTLGLFFILVLKISRNKRFLCNNLNGIVKKNLGIRNIHDYENDYEAYITKHIYTSTSLTILKRRQKGDTNLFIFAGQGW